MKLPPISLSKTNTELPRYEEGPPTLDMSTLAATFKNKSAEIHREVEGLNTERQSLDFLRGELAAAEFESSEAENAVIGENETLAMRLFKKEKLSTAEMRTLATALLPLAHAKGREKKAFKKWNAAADKFIKRAKALAANAEAHIRTMDKFISSHTASEVAAMVKEVDETSALISYSLATGGMSEVESWKFCQNLIEDFRAAKTAEEKVREFKNFSDVFCSLPKGKAPSDEEGQGFSHREHFEKLREGDAATYYNAHRAEILAEKSTNG